MKRNPAITAGYAILALLALSDALSFLLAGGGDDAPPVFVNVIGTILGLATLWAVFSIVRGRRQTGTAPRPMVLTAVITRSLSAVLGIPAFFADIDAAIKVFVGVGIALTLVGLALVRPDLAESSPRPATA